MNTQNFFDHEHLRLEAYRLLADGYYVPGQRFLDGLAKLEVCMGQVGGKAAEYVDKMKADIGPLDDPEYLKVDHARLFVGPFNLLAPPYGSVYLEGERLLMGASTADVQERYKASGLDMSVDFKDAPDHIAAELEFMHFLIFKEMEASSQSDVNGTVTCMLNQQTFLEVHLGAWVSEFAANVVGNAKTSFYRNLARATETFIKEDYHLLSSIRTAWATNPEKSAEIESIAGRC